MTQHQQPGKPAPDMIKLAIMAAGGPHEVAKAFGITHWAVRQWVVTRRVPLKKIRPLCAMGGVITPDQILAQIEAGEFEKVPA
jgi:hypothetical protein